MCTGLDAQEGRDAEARSLSVLGVRPYNLPNEAKQDFRWRNTLAERWPDTWVLRRSDLCVQWDSQGCSCPGFLPAHLLPSSSSQPTGAIAPVATACPPKSLQLG